MRLASSIYSGFPGSIYRYSVIKKPRRQLTNFSLIKPANHQIIQYHTMESNNGPLNSDRSGSGAHVGPQPHEWAGTGSGMEEAVTPIAVVGIGFRGPGDALTTEKLWKLISEGRESWSTIPNEKWNNKAFYHPDPNRNGTVCSLTFRKVYN